MFFIFIMIFQKKNVVTSLCFEYVSHTITHLHQNSYVLRLYDTYFIIILTFLYVYLFYCFTLYLCVLHAILVYCDLYYCTYTIFDYTPFLCVFTLTILYPRGRPRTRKNKIQKNIIYTKLYTKHILNYIIILILIIINNNNI